MRHPPKLAPAEAGTRQSDEGIGERVGQGGGSDRMEEAAAAQGLQELLTEEVGSGAHLLLVRAEPQDEQRLAKG